MLLDGKVAAIFNVANKRSIAWAIAKAMDAQGARLILGYLDERTKEKVEKLVDELNQPPLALVQCNVQSDEELAAAAARVKEAADQIDILVHCIAFAPKDALEKPFIETSREAFQTALDVSAYSLVALTKALQPQLRGNGSVMTLTYYGSEKVVTNYNVMGVAKAALEASVRYLASDLASAGIRVNAISAGPINTLAARGISGFTDMLKYHADKAPMKRNVESSEVANTAVFLASDLSTGITGETIYVDCGFNIMGI